MKNSSEKKLKKAVHAETVFDGIHLMQEDGNIRESLIQFAQSNGKDQEDSAFLADTMMELVRHYDEAFEAVQEANSHRYPNNITGYLLQGLHKLELEARIKALDELLFSLKIFESDALVQELRHAYPSALYEKYRQKETLPLTEETATKLENAVIAKINSFNLSPFAMERLIENTKASGFHPISAEALSRESFQFKCAAAMAIYLDNETGKNPIPVDQAVSFACTNTYMQAIADAVHAGQITEKYATYLIGALLFAAVWVAVLAMAMAFPPAVILGPVATVLCLLYAAPAASKATGRLVTYLHPKFFGTKDAILNGLFEISRWSYEIKYRIEAEARRKEHERLLKENPQLDYIDLI